MRRSMGVLLAALAVACSETSVTQVTRPSPLTRCQTALTGLPASFPASGARLNATVSTTRECGWTVESEAPWVQVAPTSGQGEASVSVQVAENPAAIRRSASVLVNGSPVTVAQDAAPCRFELDSSSSRVPAQGGAVSVAVSGVPGCVWTASSEVSWVRVMTAEVTGSGRADFVVDANTGGERAATLTIAGLPFQLQQAAAPAPEPPGPSPPSPAPPPTPGPPPMPEPGPPPGPTPPPAPLTIVMEPRTMPVGYNGQPFPGLTLRAQGGTGPYQFSATNLRGWPSSLDYRVDPVAGTAHWHGLVTREGEFPVRMVVEDSAGARSELLLTFVFEPAPTPPPGPAPLTMVMEPRTMPVGYNGQRFPGLTVRAQGGTGPYRFTGTNLLGWPSSLDYRVDPIAGTAHWHGTVTREGEFPVLMVVEDSTGARSELLLTFVFKAAP